MAIAAGDTVLFQGDSITDAGRSRENDTDLGRVRRLCIICR